VAALRHALRVDRYQTAQNATEAAKIALGRIRAELAHEHEKLSRSAEEAWRISEDFPPCSPQGRSWGL